MIEVKVTLYAKIPGAFNATTFTEWIGHEIKVTGLDPACRQVLTAVENNEDGQHSTLTVQVGHDDGPELVANLSVIMGTPKARVRAVHHETGDELVTTMLDAPLQPGQPVTIGGVPHMVADVSWPNRGETGAVGRDGGHEDVQHVKVVPVDVAPEVFSLGAVPGGLAAIMSMLK